MKIAGCIILIVMGAKFSNASDWKDVWALTFASGISYIGAALLLCSEIGLI